MSSPTHPLTRGAHHVGLTVPDLDSTRGFFIETLGFEQVGEVTNVSPKTVATRYRRALKKLEHQLKDQLS